MLIGYPNPWELCRQTTGHVRFRLASSRNALIGRSSIASAEIPVRVLDPTPPDLTN